MTKEVVIQVRHVVVNFGERSVLTSLSLDVYRGEILGVVGASGGGKSVLLRTILGLLPKRTGRIMILGIDIDNAKKESVRSIGRRCGVLFQQGALFSSLSVLENVKFPMREYLTLPDQLMNEVAIAKLEMVGLRADDGGKLPSELSGGMIKRVALARALALDPEILFLDEPTSGLDPLAAESFDKLIGALQRTLGLTVYMNTHDLDSLGRVCDRIAAIANGCIVETGSLAMMRKSKHPWVRAYFGGERAAHQILQPLSGV